MSTAWNGEERRKRAQPWPELLERRGRRYWRSVIDRREDAKRAGSHAEKGRQ